MFIKLLLLSVLFLSITMIGFGIRILVKSHGRFPETHVGRNKEMRKRGITCARKTDTGCHSTEGYPGCSTCGEGGF